MVVERIVGLKMENEKTAADRAKLRRFAEKAVEETADDDVLSKKSPKEIESLIHELRVHQIELEMQNEELRRIHEELEKTRNRYSHLYDFSPVGYLSISENGIIEEANLTVASILKVDRCFLIGKTLTQFVLKDDQDIYYKHKQRLFETEAPQVCELRFVKKDGHEFFVRLECMLINSNAKDLREIRIAVSDITESKRIENERDNLQDKLFQSQKLESIGTLAGGIAHEFNNILSIIIGNNELVMEDLPEWSHTKENTEEIRVASLRARDVVKQLLLFGRKNDQNKMPIKIGFSCKGILETDPIIHPDKYRH